MRPFLLKPAYQNYLWGGSRLKEEYHKQTDLEPLAESWELSAHPDGPSVIASGELAGMPFSTFVSQYPQLLGTACEGQREFPLLIKLIDAAQSLSVQVHPDDTYARQFENGQQGKEEMWYVLDCKEDAFLYLGFREPVGREEFARRLEDGTITQVLNRIQVRKGDAFFIEAGTIHAIGAGILVAEIQQNSNLTYRVYDYGRLGADGKPRPLHIKKALEVTRLIPSAPRTRMGGTIEQAGAFLKKTLVQCSRFVVDLVRVETVCPYPVYASSFVSILCIEGEGVVHWRETELPVRKGDSVFVPSNCGEVFVSGRGEYLFTHL